MADARLEAKLKRLHIVRFRGDMRRLPIEEVLAPFRSARSGRLVMTRLVRSIIWNAYERIRGGQEGPVEGNIRSFWYRFLKPILSSTLEDERYGQHPYDVLTYELARMVMDHRLFRYAEFDFTDENWEHRRIGPQHPHVIVYAEKVGWIRFLRRAHETLGVTTLAHGGMPSALSSEYTIDHVREHVRAGARRLAPLHLIGVVDWDPWGASCARAFERQLRAFGALVASHRWVIEPKHYTVEERRTFRVSLPRSHKKQVRDWMAQTGGVDGGRWGLEAESMSWGKAWDITRRLVQEEIGG